MTRTIIKPTSPLARRAVTKRQIANPGVTKLRKKADEVVGNNTDKIANALVKGAKKGNASSARLLVDLAENANWTERSDSVATVLSLALSDWKKEPQTVELEIVQNQPLLKPPPLGLTDGKSGPEAADGSAENTATSAEAADAEIVDGEVVEGEIVPPDSRETSVPGP